MNLKEIKEIINLMNENGLKEIEIEREGAKIRLKKETDDSSEKVRIIPEYKFEQNAHPAPTAQPESTPEKTSSSKTVEIKSPMVGTFYRAPTPDAEPFVDVNQGVEIGQVVCIIEAMKLMNEIKSEAKGKIVEVLVENGEPVEFGQPLFLIEPA